MGISIGEEEYRGRGYGTDAMRVIIRYAFRVLNLRRHHLGVFEYNPQAINPMKKPVLLRRVVCASMSTSLAMGCCVNGYPAGTLEKLRKEEQYEMALLLGNYVLLRICGAKF